MQAVSLDGRNYPDAEGKTLRPSLFPARCGAGHRDPHSLLGDLILGLGFLCLPSSHLEPWIGHRPSSPLKREKPGGDLQKLCPEVEVVHPPSLPIILWDTGLATWTHTDCLQTLAAGGASFVHCQLSPGTQ